MGEVEKVDKEEEVVEKKEEPKKKKKGKLVVKKCKVTGLYIHKETQAVIDKGTKRVTGIKLANNVVRKLKEEDIAVLEEYSLSVDPTCVEKSEEIHQEEEIPIDDEDEV